MAVVWRKSSQSTQGTSGECIEVAALSNVIGVRDSKNPEGGHLVLTPEAFSGIVRRIKGLG